MSTTQWINTNREYYRSKLINYGLHTDVIGIIVLFAAQNPSIGDLVNAPVYKNSPLWHEFRRRHKSKHKRERRSNYMCNCFIIGSVSDGISIVYQVHYIGWSNYIQEVKMEDLKPFIPFNWKAYNYQMDGRMTYSCIPIHNGYWLNRLYTLIQLKSTSEKIILFTQQIKKITKKEIFNMSPVKNYDLLIFERYLELPKYVYLCSIIQVKSILYVFAKMHPNGYV